MTFVGWGTKITKNIFIFHDDFGKKYKLFISYIISYRQVIAFLQATRMIRVPNCINPNTVRDIIMEITT